MMRKGWNATSNHNDEEGLDLTEAIQIKMKSPKFNGQFDIAQFFTL